MKNEDPQQGVQGSCRGSETAEGKAGAEASAFRPFARIASPMLPKRTPPATCPAALAALETGDDIQ